MTRKVKIVIGIVLPIILVAGTIFIAGVLVLPNIDGEELIEENIGTLNRGTRGFRGALANIPECDDTNEYFTQSHIAEEDYTGITPLGNFSPHGGHVLPTDHMYFHIPPIDKDNYELGGRTVPIVSPGHIWINEVTSSEYLEGSIYLEEGEEFTDYAIDFSPCRDVSVYFIHLTGVSDKLKEVMTEENKSCNDTDANHGYLYCSYKMDIELQPGDPIGTAGGGVSANVDLGSYDYRKELSEAEEKSRRPEKSKYTTCPLQYFESDVRDEFYARVGEDQYPNGFVNRTIEPICGEVIQDELGTAKGTWADLTQIESSGTIYQEEPHINLSRDVIDPSRSTLSIGQAAEKIGTETAIHYYTPATSGDKNRDFSDMTPGQTYCIETEREDPYTQNSTTQVFLLEMPNEETLHIEGISSPTCEEGPWKLSSSAAEFVR